MLIVLFDFFFLKQKTAYEMRISDWSSDVCSSDLPTLVAVYRKLPLLLMVAPITASPGPFLTGIDSPVNIDSSTWELPSMISPSTGILSPEIGRASCRERVCQ